MNRKLSLLAVPYAVWLFLLVVIPILIMAVYAFTTSESAATLENFTDMGIYASVFVRSFRLAAIATLICLLIGYPAAYFMAGEGESFQRVALEPGEEKTVRFTLQKADMGFFDNQAAYRLEPGLFRLFVGGSSDELLEQEVTLR